MHDAKNRPLAIGDRVLLPATIMSLGQSEEFCNVGIKSAIGRRPDGQAETWSGLNTGTLLRANDGDENDLADAFSSPPT